MTPAVGLDQRPDSEASLRQLLVPIVGHNPGGDPNQVIVHPEVVGTALLMLEQKVSELNHWLAEVRERFCLPEEMTDEQIFDKYQPEHKLGSDTSVSNDPVSITRDDVFKYQELIARYPEDFTQLSGRTQTILNSFAGELIRMGPNGPEWTEKGLSWAGRDGDAESITSVDLKLVGGDYVKETTGGWAGTIGRWINGGRLVTDGFGIKLDLSQPWPEPREQNSARQVVDLQAPQPPPPPLCRDESPASTVDISAATAAAQLTEIMQSSQDPVLQAYSGFSYRNGRYETIAPSIRNRDLPQALGDASPFFPGIEIKQGRDGQLIIEVSQKNQAGLSHENLHRAVAQLIEEMNLPNGSVIKSQPDSSTGWPVVRYTIDIT